MYDIPTNRDWSPLMGTELLQICYGRHQVQLNFQADVTISIEGKLEHLDQDKTLAMSESGAPVASLLQLLGASIVRITVPDESHLRLEFSNGHALCLFKGGPDYECFSINAPGLSVIV